MLGSVSAVDLGNVTDDSNLLDDNKDVFSTQDLEVSSNDSISETNLVNSRDDNLNNYPSDVIALSGDADDEDNILESQYFSEDSIQASTVKSTLLVGNDTELYFKNGTAYQVNLADDEGNPLANQKIIFTINGQNYTRTTNANGTASMSINLNSGNYDFIATYAGTSSYAPSSTKNIIKVLSTVSGNDIEKYFRNNTQYYATFVNGQGVVLNNTTVSFNINGVYYNRTTNANGTAKMNINLNSGEYIITAINPINGEMHSNNITVLTSLYGFDVVKYFKNGTQYYITVVNATGGPLVNESVSFNINGLYYNRTTNANGTAKMNINLYPGEYIITAINPINGEMHSNNITVLPTISGNDVDMMYRDGSRYNVTVLNDVGKALANSIVTFNINGVYYNRTTDKYGNAYLNINLNVGNYVITATDSKGLSVSNKITIKKCGSIISGNNSHVITGTDKKYTVKLMGLNNKTVNSATVQFTYANRTVTALTNENGEASIVISNLSEGKYDIKYVFDGDGNYYASESNSTLTVANSTVILSANDLKMVYNDGSSFKVTLTDLDGKPLANHTISLSINGVTYNRTTNSEGVVSLGIKLIPNNYTVVYSHSNVDAEDYNIGKNTISVAKLSAKFSADDLVINAGEKGVFNVTLKDSKNAPIKDMVVTFNIHNVLYNRTTDENGVAKMNIGLEVGYYTIKASIDNIFYEAKPMSKHILVNGSVLTGSDINMIVGKPSTFSVSLKDAYGKAISNAPIKFTYSDVTTTANTGSNGVASITISNLVKGDYPIVYTYDKTNTSGMAYIHVIGTIPIAKLVSAANTVNAYIERNAKLPSSVSIDGVSYSTAKYLYLLSEAIVNINNNDLSDLYVLDIKDPSNPGAAANLGNLNNYVPVAQSLMTSMNSGVTPNSVSTSVGNVGYDGLVYAFTRVMVYYGEMSKLPSYVSIKSLKIYESSSVLDSANTISDLSAYLAASKNCEVNDPEIVALAQKLTKGLTTSLEKATAIYNYVRDEISYSFYYDTRYGAVDTLHAGTGNCVDQAHLVIALYRAADLPARYVHGTCVFSSGSTYGHVWAQVLIGDTWIVSDPTSSRNSFDKVVNWNNYNYSLKGYFPAIYF